MSFSWLPAGITLSNSDRLLATVISVYGCGQRVSIEYDTEGHSGCLLFILDNFLTFATLLLLVLGGWWMVTAHC